MCQAFKRHISNNFNLSCKRNLGALKAYKENAWISVGHAWRVMESSIERLMRLEYVFSEYKVCGWWSVESLLGILKDLGPFPHMLKILFPQTTSWAKHKRYCNSCFINDRNVAKMFSVLPKVMASYKILEWPHFQHIHSFTHLFIYEHLLCASNVRPKTKVQYYMLPKYMVKSERPWMA